MDRKIYLIVTSFFPTPESWRGAFCYDFAKALIALRQYDVRVFVPGSDRDYDYQGIRVYGFKTRQLPSAILPFLFRRSNLKSFRNAVSRAGIAWADIAVCHAHTAFNAIYAIEAKRQNKNCLTLLHHHDLQSFGLNLGILSECWLYNMLMFPILRHYHEQIDCHVFISTKCRESFLKAPDASWCVYDHYRRQMRGLPYRPVRVKRSLILHNGVDTSLFHPVAKKGNNSTVHLDLISRPRFFTIGCIANFVPLKDHLTLLRALDKIKDRLGSWQLRLLGSGPMRKEIENYIAEHGMQDNVEFLSEVDHTQLPRFYQSFDLFVLPSFFEGFGCVFTEAAACGVPFITCKGQGIADVVGDEWLIEPHDADALACMILKFYEQCSAQQLKSPIAIDELVGTFIGKINEMVGLTERSSYENPASRV